MHGRPNTHQPSANRERGEDHVVVVDEEDELVAVLTKLVRQTPTELLHFRLHLRQQTIHALRRKRLIQTGNCRRELGVATHDLRVKRTIGKLQHAFHGYVNLFSRSEA